MLATMVSLIAIVFLSLGVEQVPEFETILSSFEGLFTIFFEAGIFLSLLPWICMLFISQGAEVNPITIAALRSNLADNKLRLYSIGIFAVSLLGVFVSVQSLFPSCCSIAVSLLCVGLLIDLLRMAYCRFQFRRTPEGLAEWFKDVMLISVKKSDEKWYTISYEIPFTMMGMYMKSGAYGSLRLFCHAIVNTSPLWLRSIAWFKISRLADYDECLLDKYVDAELKLAKRLTWLLQEARDLGSLPGLEEITRLVGRVFITFHNHHESLGNRLLSMLSDVSKRDFGKIELNDVDVEVLSTFANITQLLIERCVNRNLNDADTIHKVLALYENKVTEIFSREKRVRFDYFTQPIIVLDRMLEGSRYISFPGRESVLGSIQRVLLLVSSLVETASHASVNGKKLSSNN
jgi:hypothetical protein